jgi:hypothetical protein
VNVKTIIIIEEKQARNMRIDVKSLYRENGRNVGVKGEGRWLTFLIVPVTKENDGGGEFKYDTFDML